MQSVYNNLDFKMLLCNSYLMFDMFWHSLMSLFISLILEINLPSINLSIKFDFILKEVE